MTWSFLKVHTTRSSEDVETTQANNEPPTLFGQPGRLCVDSADENMLSGWFWRLPAWTVVLIGTQLKFTAPVLSYHIETGSVDETQRKMLRWLEETLLEHTENAAASVGMKLVPKGDEEGPSQ